MAKNIQPQPLAVFLEEYGAWRERLADQVLRLKDWMDLEELSQPGDERRIDQALEKLREDRLVIAFVAEFSRGKSELINALFFATLGQRILPTSAGRTTMCPTELLYDPADAPEIRLLPIETRGEELTISDLKRDWSKWTTVPLQLDSPEQLGAAIAAVSHTQRVPVETARAYGLYHEDDALNAVTVGTDRTVNIPRWRHAVINFPHPLLKQGLVILDTPGLNAIGTEPELTLNLLPNAHAVLFILAADAGVTKTDIEVWRGYIAGEEKSANRGRFVVLNKIDGLWDELKSHVEIAAEIKRQVQATAELLGLSRDQVLAVSAKKGFIAKVNGDDSLLERSRLGRLESAISSELLPAKREIVGEAVRREVLYVSDQARALLESRFAHLQVQLGEFRALRGKNQDVVSAMLERARYERTEFDKTLQQFLALRSVFTQHSNKLFVFLGKEAVRTEIAKTRQTIEASNLTRDIRSAMTAFFRGIESNLTRAGEQATEISDMMKVMYAKSAEDPDSPPFIPPDFSMLRFHQELERLERAFEQHFNTLWNMLSKEKAVLQRQFFQTVTSRVMRLLDVANRDAEHWVKAVIGPMENRIRENQVHQRRRLESIKRIHDATEELEDRIKELEQSEASCEMQQVALAALVRDLESRTGVGEG